jgi:hypothetical protein
MGRNVDVAEILIAARDLPSGYRRGDPVAVKPNGQTWGNAEVLPDFYVVKIPGLDMARAQTLLDDLREPARLGDLEFNAPDAEDRFVKRHRRRVRIVIEDLVDRVALERDGTVTTTVNGIRDATRQLVYDRGTERVALTDEREFPSGRP